MRWGLLAMTAGLLLLALTTPGAEAARRMKGGKQHHRSKRTIGAIINWKLNLLQNIFGGISGIFGGGGGSGGGSGSSSSYGAPSQSYGVPSQSYGAPARDGLLYVNLCFFFLSETVFTTSFITTIKFVSSKLLFNFRNDKHYYL